MNRRGTGVIFCLIASILFSVRYIIAAIFMSNVSTWTREIFYAGLEYQGNVLLYLSVISFIVGILYLVWAEISSIKTR